MILEDKFLVLKRADILDALSVSELQYLDFLCEKIRVYRAKQGKPENHYVVINCDEPYFPDVLKLMEVEK